VPVGIVADRRSAAFRLLSDHVGFERADFVENRLDVRLGDAVLSERLSEIGRDATEGLLGNPIPSWAARMSAPSYETGPPATALMNWT